VVGDVVVDLDGDVNVAVRTLTASTVATRFTSPSPST
jgi:hypothetical protein